MQYFERYGVCMVEMFRLYSEQLSEKKYIDIKEKLSSFCNKEILFIRELSFSLETDMDITENFRIILNRMDKSHLYLIKAREGNDCFIQNVTSVTIDDYKNIINGRYDEMKESCNELIRDLAWNLELGNYKVGDMVEYIQEKYESKTSGEQFIFKSLKVDIDEGADMFLSDNLTSSTEVDYDKKELMCMSKIHMPVMLKHAV